MAKKSKEEVKYASDVNWMALTSVTRIWEKEIKRTHCNVETELEAREHSKHNYQCFASKLGWHFKSHRVCPKLISVEHSHWRLDADIYKRAHKNQAAYTNQCERSKALWETGSDFKLILIIGSKIARWNKTEEGMNHSGRSEDLGHTH